MENPKKKILLIEDDVSICKLYKIAFEKRGFELSDFHNGINGLEEAQSGKYDLLLLDLMLPGMNGFDVLTKLKQSDEARDLPVIVLTNLSGSDALEAKNLGALDCLLKASLTPDEVVDKVANLAFS